MPSRWSKKRERQYEHIKDSLNQLYGEAKRKGIEGCSSMNKAELKRAVDRA